jgi:hypothetical protein
MATAERGDGAEVAVVEGQQAGSTEPSRQDHNRGVCQPESKVGVLLVQPRGQRVLIWSQALYQELPRRHITQERPGRLRSPATLDQVVRLRRDRGRHDQLSRAAREDSQARTRWSRSAAVRSDARDPSTSIDRRYSLARDLAVPGLWCGGWPTVRVVAPSATSS